MRKVSIRLQDSVCVYKEQPAEPPRALEINGAAQCLTVSLLALVSRFIRFKKFFKVKTTTKNSKLQIGFRMNPF